MIAAPPFRAARRALAPLIVLVLPAVLWADGAALDAPLAGGYLGIRLAPAEAGLRVDSVEEGGAADSGGLRPGDVLLRFGDHGDLGELGSPGLSRLLVDWPRGRSVEILARRGEDEIRLEITPDPILVRDAVVLADRLRRQRVVRSLEGKERLVERLDHDLRAAVRGSRTRREALEAMNRVIDRLGISHLAMIPAWTWASLLGAAHGEGGSHHLGILVQRHVTPTGARWFVLDLDPNGPAADAGARIGDELALVDGVPFERSPRRVLAGFEASREIATLVVERGETVEVGLRSRANEAPRVLSLRADRPLSAEAATRASVRLVETDAGPLGYVRLWDLLQMSLVGAFRDALSGPLRDARGLLVDLRGRGGTVQVLRAVAEAIRRDGRPTALLIDSETRSAKEILAHMLREDPRVTLVGERTAGAVRPASYVELSNGARAMIPIGNGRQVLPLTDGVDLEGVGVAPEVAVEFELPWAAGRDPILERGREVLIEALSAAGRRLRI